MWANIVEEKLENCTWSKSHKTLQAKIKYLNFNLIILETFGMLCEVI